MPKNNLPPFRQTAIGDNNVQIIGSNNTIIQKIFRFFRVDSKEQRFQNNRHAIIQRVGQTWVTNILEKPIIANLFIKLSLDYKPDAVIRQWNRELNIPNQPTRAISPETSLIDVLDELNGSLLVLGAPGSGKTTALIELARDAIKRAEKDSSYPIPVIFNLSSWIEKDILDSQPMLATFIRKKIEYKKVTFDLWLEDELANKYFISKDIARSWIENDNLLLLFDGLDEVTEGYRNICVTAINNFRLNHGSTQIVVCSRIFDYEELNTRLDFQGAVIIRPLTDEQIDEYLIRAGNQFTNLRSILMQDNALIELARQPLMLSIMVMSYQNTAILSNLKEFPIIKRRKLLFDVYIQQMFKRTARTKNELYSPKQTKTWLQWLAQRMSEREASQFFLRDFQISWLQQKPYRQDLFAIFTLVAIILINYLYSQIISISPISDKSGWISNFEILFFFLIFKFGAIPVMPTEALKWNWIHSVIWAFILVIVFVFLGSFQDGLISGIFTSVYIALLGGIGGGLKSRAIESTYLHQEFRLSIKNALKVWVGVGLALVLFNIFYDLFFTYYLHSNLEYSLLDSLKGDVVIGILIGGYFALHYGFYAVIYHYILRFMLYISNYIPWDYVRFLDFATDHIFLRRVGNGYMFIHRLILEHFASLDMDI